MTLSSLRTLVQRRLTLQLGLWVLLCTLPALLLGGWLLAAVYMSMTRTVTAAAQATAAHALDTLDRLVFERYGDAITYSRLPVVRAMDRAALPVMADLLVTTYAPYYRLVLVADREGRIVAASRVDGAGRPISSGQLLGRSVAGESWFADTQRGASPVRVDDFHVDPLVQAVYGDQQPAMSFSAPIRSGTGEVVGVWSARLAMGPLAESVAGFSSHGASGAPMPLVLLNRQGQEILRSAWPVIEEGRPGGLVVHQSSPALLATATSTGFAGYGGLGWQVQVYRPPGQVEWPVVVAALGGCLVLLVLGGGAGLFWIVRSRVLVPVQRLARQVERLGQGEFPDMSESGTSQPHEIGDLERAVRVTGSQLAEQVGRLQGLREVSRALQQARVHEISEAALRRFVQLVVEQAVRLTGAQYGALGVFDASGERLTQFVQTGIDEATAQAIGSLPAGRGLLGLLTREEKPLRLKDLTRHPASVGFPPHHPMMRSFLGASIRTHGRLFGRIYLTEKQGGEEFTALDELIVETLASHAGVAIEDGQVLMQIKEAEAQYRLLLESTGEGIWGLDRDGRCTFINAAGAALLGYEAHEVVGRMMHDLVQHHYPDGRPYPSEASPIYDAFRSGQGHRVDTEVLWRQDGSSFPAEYASFPIRRDDVVVGAVVTFTDITQRKHLEERLRQSQKLEAVGRLAGGIAHDFNNLLTAIMGSGEIMLSQLSDADAIRLHIEEIKTAVRRGSALTGQLLAFSRRQALQPTVMEVSVLVTEMARMLHRLIGEDIELALVSGTEQACVKADRGQLEQVVLNLAVNARDAMPGGGRLTIETGVASLEAPHCPPTLSPGRYARLIVRDTGCGMDATTRGHIFEPFFTTKEMGKGTGLGLATVYGIVEQSGGAITVESAPGLGTTVTVYLPAVTEAPLPEAPGGSRAVPPTGSETVLLVEDDDLVRGPIAKGLRLAGYAVLVAADPAEALQVAEERGKPIHLLVTDVVMPQMNGRDLARRVTALHPRIKVLYMSGYAADILHSSRESDTDDPTRAFLQKPFTLDELARTVRDVLDGATQPG
jgi:PAS domain S-box-containing protein